MTRTVRPYGVPVFEPETESEWASIRTFHEPHGTGYWNQAPDNSKARWFVYDYDGWYFSKLDPGPQASFVARPENNYFLPKHLDFAALLVWTHGFMPHYVFADWLEENWSDCPVELLALLRDPALVSC